jgi:NADP-dependent 3-hydroxy acid dehydrogenase YdfG
MKTLEGKVIAITGAGSGIGRGLALHAARRGASLSLCDWNEVGLAETVDEVTPLLRPDAKLHHQRVDVGEEADITSFAHSTLGVLGPAHVIVNNAGVSVSDFAATMKRSDFEWVMNINFWGVIRGTEAFLPQLRAHDDAHVVNVSSIFGIIAVPSQSAYNAAKFAVRGYTEALRQELHGSPIRVTCVHPGGVKTNIVRNGRQVRNVRGTEVTTHSLAERFAASAMTTPERAADIIWGGVLSNAPRVLVGPDAHLLDLLQRALPTGYTALLRLGSRWLT